MVGIDCRHCGWIHDDYDCRPKERPIVATQQVGAPHDYEPDYDTYIRDLASIEESMADVARYEDWFVEYE